MGEASTILLSLITFIGGIAITLYIKDRGELHERRVAIFNVEVEELKQQLALVDRASMTLHRYYQISEAREAELDLFTESEWLAAMREVHDVYNSFKAGYLTTSKEFEERWRELYTAYTIAYVDVTAAEAFGKWSDNILRVDNACEMVRRLLKQGLANFKVGEEVYSSSQANLKDIDSSYF